MPNHFHFLIVPKEEACKNIILNEKETHMQVFSKTIGKTLSSYTKAINIQQQTTGNLFQKKTKAKILIPDKLMANQFSQRDYLETCFHYIHLNPFIANLVHNMSDWPYSSWPDFYGLRSGTLINKKMFMELSGYSKKDFEIFTQRGLNPLIVKNIF
jgi:REP element-mobilizing transposase RayT